jgi:hypothetical protein
MRCIELPFKVGMFNVSMNLINLTKELFSKIYPNPSGIGKFVKLLHPLLKSQLNPIRHRAPVAFGVTLNFRPQLG